MLSDTIGKCIPGCRILQGSLFHVVGYYRVDYSTLWDTPTGKIIPHCWILQGRFSMMSHTSGKIIPHCGILQRKSFHIVGYYREDFSMLSDTTGKINPHCGLLQRRSFHHFGILQGKLFHVLRYYRTEKIIPPFWATTEKFWDTKGKIIMSYDTA